MRGGGKHKDKKSKTEKKHAESGKTLEQKFVEEVRSDKSPVIRECDKDATLTRQEPMSDVSQETQERDENNMTHLLDEDSMKSWIEFWSKESDNEVGQRIENWLSVLLGVKEVDVERANIWKCGMRWAVETRRKERGGEQEQNTGQEQGKQDKQVRFSQEEQQEGTKAESTGEPEVTGRLAEMRTGRGSSGLVRRGDEKCQADETSRKGDCCCVSFADCCCLSLDKHCATFLGSVDGERPLGVGSCRETCTTTTSDASAIWATASGD